MDGRLYALEMTTGEIVWQKEFQGKFKASPAVAFSRLVIASDDGVIYCLGSAVTPN
jgi:outer membrane protein assembly factor BamB